MIDLQNITKIPNGYRLVPFSTAHFYLYEHSTVERAAFDAFPGYLEWLETQSQIGPSATAIFNGIAIMSFGVVPTIPGVADLWMLRGNALKVHGKPFLRSAKHFFDNLGPAMDLRRVQFTVHSQNFTGVRFAKWLEFNVEGTLRAMMPDGSDCIQMSRIYSNGRII